MYSRVVGVSPRTVSERKSSQTLSSCDEDEFFDSRVTGDNAGALWESVIEISLEISKGAARAASFSRSRRRLGGRGGRRGAIEELE